MKIAIPTSSTSLEDLIKSVSGGDQIREAIHNNTNPVSTFWKYGVELQYFDEDFFVETILDEAVVDEARKVDSIQSTFSFNVDKLNAVQLIWTSGSFILSIV